MPKVKISEYSATANSNTDVASINIDEGCAPSGINNAIRAIMGHLKDFQSGTSNDPFTIGSSGSLTLSYGTANGVAYLNGSKVLTTGSVLVFDGSNLGLGVTPSAKLTVNGSTAVNTSAGYTQFQPNGIGALVGGYGANNTANLWLAGGTGNNNNQVGHYINSVMAGNGGGGGSASLQIGQLAWSGTAFTSGSTQMTLDASGNLGIGTTTSLGRVTTAGSGDQSVWFTHTDNVPGRTVTLRLGNNDATYKTYSPYIQAIEGSGFDNYSLAFGTSSGSSGGAVERARIDSSGNLLVGTTSQLGGGKVGMVQTTGSQVLVLRNTNASTPYGLVAEYTGSAPNSVSSQFIYCNDTGGLRMEVRSNGGIANYSANNVNLSDRREKTNFAPAKSYLDVICAIPVQTFNYIDQNLEEDSGLTLGVVAQDVQAVAPEMVMESNWGTEEEPKMRLSIYQTDLQYALMKCIQEQQSLITTLTARITALESA